MKRFIRAVLPHALLVLSVMFLVLLVLHEWNPTMNFIGSSVSRIWLLGFCIVAVINAVQSIVRNRSE